MITNIKLLGLKVTSVGLYVLRKSLHYINNKQWSFLVTKSCQSDPIFSVKSILTIWRTLFYYKYFVYSMERFHVCLNLLYGTIDDNKKTFFLREDILPSIYGYQHVVFWMLVYTACYADVPKNFLKEYFSQKLCFYHNLFTFQCFSPKQLNSIKFYVVFWPNRFSFLGKK